MKKNSSQVAGGDSLACVILAAGEGKRMQSSLAKVLHRLAGKPLVAHVAGAARCAGIRRMVVVTSAGDGPAVEAVVGPDARYVVQKERLGTGHALAQAQKVLKDFAGNLVVLCGDAPLVRPETVCSLIKTHVAQGNVCTVLTATLDDAVDYGRIVRNGAGHVLRIVEEKEANAHEKSIREVNSGAYCMQVPRVFDALSKIHKKNVHGEYRLTDIVALLIEEGAPVGCHLTTDSGEITGINSRSSLALAGKILQRRIAERHMANGVTIVDPDNTYIGCDVAIGQDTVIEPFTVMEGAVRVGRHCHVGPFAHLREGTILEDAAEIGNFVEVKKSLIGAGSKAKHLTYLGDATVGRKANIGAGTITANYDGKKKHATLIGDGAQIGSNTTLVAPVRVGAGAVTGAGCVVLSGRHVPAGGVAVGVPARVLGRRK